VVRYKIAINMHNTGNKECASRQFDVSRTKLSTRFMAGRGQVLIQALNKPLQAQEFAKRKKLQEMLFRGELKLDQSNIPEDLLPLNLIRRSSKIPESPIFSSSEISCDYMSEPSTRQQQAQNKSEMFTTAAPSAEMCNHNKYTDQFSNTEMSKGIQQPTVDNPESNSCTSQTGFVPKDFEKKNAAKPLRKPDKSRKKHVAIEKKASLMLNIDQNRSRSPRGIDNQSNMSDERNAWLDWENNVIIQGSLTDEDLPGIAAVEDNDDLNDVVVNQYIDALQSNNHSTKGHGNSKLTPERVQQFSNLKSTSNADCMRVLPGTQPNPPKGDDRWGGTELNGSKRGWGDPGNDHRNDYDDGSSLWSAEGSQYGGISWSNAC
ncbi:hypothetical protein QZH41_009020, partial [Actinostola sp. cb2023]